MTRTLLAAILLCCSSVAWAQTDDDDAPIPYDDGSGDTGEAPRPRKKRRPDALREEDEDARRNEEESLVGLDDPNVGVGGSFLSGLALLESSKNGVDPRYYLGVRFTWEFGRLMNDPFLREMFFADVMWMYSWTQDGTDFVKVSDHLHDFTVAPAIALRFGESFMSAYAQLGAGFSYSQSISTVGMSNVTLGGTKFLFQYGIGLRGRPAVVADGSVRIEFRVELTRFIRGYIHDMMIGAGVGMIF